MPGVEEALALDPRSGVRRIKRRIVVRLVEICSLFFICKADLYQFFRVGATERPDHEVARLLGETRGTYFPVLGGWLVSFEQCDNTLFL